MGFPSGVQERALIACERHCCICHKFCSFKIELHHIVQKADGGEDSFDNCIPLCFDCHAEVKSYNNRHPKGKKYTESELKIRRDRWYEKVESTYQPTSSNLEQLGLKQIDKMPTMENWPETLEFLTAKFPEIKTVRSQETARQTIEHSQKEDSESITNNSTDYTFSSPEIFKTELESLKDRAKKLEEERQSALDLGLKGAVTATEEESKIALLQMQILRKRVEIIEQGYEFWERIGFISACEACCWFDYWYSVGNVKEQQFIDSGEIDIRIPQDVLEKLKLAIDSGMFEEFILCTAIEPPDDPEDVLAKSVRYYLFGSPPNTATFENDDLFLIDIWNLE